MQITVTQEEYNRSPSYALGVATGQVAGGFSITTVANKPDGVFDGTYTITIPDGKITKAEFQAIIDNPEQAPDVDKYKRDRAAAYPSIGDQLDMQYHDGVNGTTTWADAIAAVKTKYAKP